VIRDFYHRYTVDEHSFMTLENSSPSAGESQAFAQETSGPAKTWERKFGEILSELEQPELLYFTLLFHDVGKGMPEFDSHVEGSLLALDRIQARLELPEEAWETVQFLVGSHLEMSAASQRRDVFDRKQCATLPKLCAPRSA